MKIITKRNPFQFIGILLCLLFCNSSIQAQTTAIPDTTFEQRLIALGIDSDGLVNGQILNSDALGVQILDLTQSNIRDLTGLSAFISLRELEVDNNYLTQIDVTANTLLEKLDVSNTQITTLDLSSNTALVELDGSSNYLTTLNLLSNTNLEVLRCDLNQLTSLDLSNNLLLKDLFCRYNQITSLNVLSNVNLVNIYCVDNQLTSLGVSNLLLLENLNCMDNQLTSLNVQNTPALSDLVCVNNLITALNVSNSPLLTDLECSNNQLSILVFPNSTALINLQAGGNLLTSIDIAHCSNIHTVNVRNNFLSTIDVSNNPTLFNLDINNNGIPSIDLSNNPALYIFSASGNNLTTLDLSNNIVLNSLYANANQLSLLRLPNTNLSKMYCNNNMGFLQICVDDVAAAQAKPTSGSVAWVKDHSAVYTDACYQLSVEGRVAVDTNNNCLADSVELGLANQMVRFEKGGIAYYFTTYNSNGDYQAFLDTGTYTVTVIPNSSYWQACPTSQVVQITSSNIPQILDWALQPVILCSQLRVDISTPILRPTAPNFYSVYYCNEGTTMANNAYVEVLLDPDLNVLSTGLPIVSQVGNLYTFNIGNVGVAACGVFNIEVIVDLSAQAGQTHCTEAHIYPDTICTPNIWVNSRLAVDAECQNDTVFFMINNLGAAMSQPRTYYVFEDNIMMRQSTFQIGVGGSQQVIQPADTGKTYRIIAKQESGYPSLLGDSVITAVVEGCVPFLNGSFNTGFVTQFSNGNSAPFIAVDCQQNVTSYDPNDKSAQPEGYDMTNHYIYDYTALDYKIRFQNTGTDTAFNIIILDTISPYLDLATLEMGASSHNYTWSIQNGNVLNIKFANIMLPDSNVNEPLSNGFFRYRIEQKANNALGTIINNSAAIYFDFNPPVMTNKTWHTVGEDFVTSIVLNQTTVLDESIAVNVYPNPFQEMTTLVVQGKDYEQLELSVFDVAGRMVKTITSTKHNRIELSRNGMTQGVYFYQLKGDGALINTGKVIVQ
jgi:hypothetical protein